MLAVAPEDSLGVRVGVPGFLLHGESRFGQQGLEPARQMAESLNTL